MAAAPVLDFDTIFILNQLIPESFQPEWNNNNANPVQLTTPVGRYIYFTVMRNGAPLHNNVNFAATNVIPGQMRLQRPPQHVETNIYFPIDGSQPTTPEAVKYSCANIDNRLDSPITEWYMQMFGVIPFNANNYIKAGWSAPALGNGAINEQRIISFDTNCAGPPHDQCSVVSYENPHRIDDPNVPGAQISRRTLFERAFRKIASTSVGRVLLYRILLEIRRHITAGDNNGCQEAICACPNDVVQSARNRHRSMTICWDNDGFGFSPYDNSIGSRPASCNRCMV